MYGYGGIQAMSTLYHNLPNVYQLPGQLPGAAGPMQGNVNTLQGIPPQGLCFASFFQKLKNICIHTIYFRFNAAWWYDGTTTATDASTSYA